MWEKHDIHTPFGSDERERVLGSARCRWEDNSKIVCKEIVSGDGDLVHLCQAPSGVLFQVGL